MKIEVMAFIIILILCGCSERSEDYTSENCTLEKGDIITLTLFEETRVKSPGGTISIISYAHCRGTWSAKRVFRVYFHSDVQIPWQYGNDYDDFKYILPLGTVLQVKIKSVKSQSSYYTRLIAIL